MNHKWTRRALLGGAGAVAGAAALGFGVLASRDGAALVPGVARARKVVGDDTPPAKVDVVVIGGGNVGCLTALTLAERGLRVALCEKGVIAGEASGRSLGYIESQFLHPAKMEIIGRSKALWAGMNERVQAETGYRRTGLATCFLDRAALDATQGWIDAVHGQPGVDARLITEKELATLLPQAGDRFAGALYQPSDGCAEPTLAAPAIADAVRRHGGHVLQQCAVRGIETSAGRVSGVVTERGPIACQAVVLAGGVWSPVLARTLGLDVPQFMAFSGIARLSAAPGPQLSMISETGFALRPTLTGGYDVCTAIGTAPITPSTLRHLPRLRPALSHMWDQLRPAFDLGTFMAEWRIPTQWRLDQPSPFETNRILMPETRHALLAEVVANAKGTLPALKDTQVLEQWSGALMSTLDNMPVVSAADGVPGLYLGTGFYYGLTMGPAAGEALADLVMGRQPQIDLAPYRYARFHDGSPIVFHD